MTIYTEYASVTDALITRGLECVIEYNGLVLNDRLKPSAYVITEITGLEDADIRDSREENPDRDGEFAYDARYGGRTITLKGYIRTGSIPNLRNMQAKLNQAFGNLSSERELLFRFNDVDDSFEVPYGLLARYTNQVTNPSFEVDTTGWASGATARINAGATLTRVTSQQNSGVASLQVVTGTGTTLRGADFTSIPVVAGQTYQVSAWVKGNAGGESVRITIGDVTVGSASGNLTASTAWQRVSASFTPSVSGLTGVAVLNVPNSNVTFFVDSVSVVIAPTLPTYFDGDTNGGIWSGTPHNSTSLLYDHNGLADYSLLNGTGLAVGNGMLVPTDASNKRISHNRRLYDDVEVTSEVQYGTTVANYEGNPALKILDTNNSIWATYESSVLRIYKMQGGANSILGTVAVTPPTASSVRWIRLRIIDNIVTAEWWSTAPSILGTPDSSVSYTLTTAEAAQFGSGVFGRAGIWYWIPDTSLTSRILSFKAHSLNPGDLSASCRKVAKLDGPESQPGLNNYRRDFMISLRASDGLLKSREYIKVTIPIANGTLTFPGGGAGLTFPTTGEGIIFAQTADVSAIVNMGSRNSRPIIRFNGPVVDPFIYDISSNQRIGILGELLAGQYVIADCDARTIVDQGGNSVYEFLVSDYNWLEIGPGVNYLAMGATSGSGTTNVYWKHTT